MEVLKVPYVYNCLGGVSEGGTGRNLGTKHTGTGTTLILDDSRHYIQ